MKAPKSRTARIFKYNNTEIAISIPRGLASELKLKTGMQLNLNLLDNEELILTKVKA